MILPRMRGSSLIWLIDSDMDDALPMARATPIDRCPSLKSATFADRTVKAA
jgi:hypothetical protein